MQTSQLGWRILIFARRCIIKISIHIIDILRKHDSGFDLNTFIFIYVYRLYLFISRAEIFSKSWTFIIYGEVLWKRLCVIYTRLCVIYTRIFQDKYCSPISPFKIIKIFFLSTPRYFVNSHSNDPCIYSDMQIYCYTADLSNCKCAVIIYSQQKGNDKISCL